MSAFDVAVIGAGASGTLVTAQFRRQAPAYGRLALLGAGLRAGRGVAYETPHQTNLLNVPAGNMSAFPDDPEHFVRWLSVHQPSADARTFASRTLYGNYLADILAETLPGPAVLKIPQQVVGLTKSDGLWVLHLDDGNTLSARAVVLALGNQPPNDPFGLTLEAPSGYFSNPWAEDVALGLDPDAPVVLIGTGLTMIDTVLVLRAQGHRGRLTAISRHGRLSQVHAPYAPRPLAQLPEAFGTPHTALNWIRTEIRASSDWRAVIDSLRPHTSTIWQIWTPAQRASFLRHARNLWDIHRHRMAPEAAAQLNKLIQSGELVIHHGQPVTLKADNDRLIVIWRETGNDTLHHTHAARVINCTGPNRDYRQVNTPLIAALRQRGWLTTDPFHLGWQTDQDGRLIGADGTPVPGLFTLGPLRIPDLWESVAIPEIRVQAAKLVKLLTANLTEPEPVPDFPQVVF